MEKCTLGLDDRQLPVYTYFEMKNKYAGKRKG